MPLVTDQVIHIITERALDIYLKDEDPMSLVDFAAHKITLNSAEKHSMEAAEAAAFVGAAVASSSMLKSASYIGALLPEKLKANDHNRHYSNLANILRGHPLPPPVETTFHFKEAIETLNKNEYTQSAYTAFQKTYTSDEKAKLACTTACTIYPLAVHTTYMSFFEASRVANQVSSEERPKIFKTKFTKQLKKGLGSVPISAHFFLQAMCSNALLCIGPILLMVGVSLLCLGICGLTVASVSAFMLNFNLNRVAMVIAGSMFTLTGAGLLAGNFFSKQTLQREHEADQKIIEKMLAHHL